MSASPELREKLRQGYEARVSPCGDTDSPRGEWPAVDVLSSMDDTGSTSVDLLDGSSPRPRTSWFADELMAQDFPDPRWAVPGILAEGVNLLAGSPKVGKSWLALGIGVAVASGGRALGRVKVAEGDVLYLALEDTGRRLQSRLRAVLGTDPAPPRLKLATFCERLDEGGQVRIRKWLQSTPDARLVIVDVLTKVRPQSKDSANRYESDYGAVSALKALADEFGVAFLLVHHVRKAASEDFLDAVSGTNGLAGAADCVLVLARSRGNASAVLKLTGRDVEEAEHPLEFKPDTGTWLLLDGAAADYELGDTRRRILHLLRDVDFLTPQHVADRLDISEDNARQTLRRMAKAEQVDTDGQGRYFAPLSPVTPVTPVTCSPSLSDTSDRCDRAIEDFG